MNVNVLDDTLTLTKDLGIPTSEIVDYTGRAVAPTPAATPSVIEVTREKTQDALVRVASESGGRIVILNFASAVSPGGGARFGFHAQEEDLCFCSNLIVALETDALDDFYQQNCLSRTPFDGPDTLIVSHDVTFVKGGDYQPLATPVTADVISYAAPIVDRCGAEMAATALRRRAFHVVDTARHLKADTLILGAWGCGVYGNDPTVAAIAFKEALVSFEGRVVFAVFGNAPNYRAFSQAFGGGRVP